MGTDRDWEKWGETDPYFGVLSSEEYRADKIDDAARDKFFRSGDEHIEHVLATARARLDEDFQPVRSLDFGCGVGRLVIPLASLSESVTGVDVSEHMLAEAAANCRERQIENASFVASDDRLSRLTGSFNFIHSYIVLQHIPARRGMRLLEALAQRLEPRGVVVVQFCFRCDAPALIRSLVKLRYRLPLANAARNLLRGRPLGEPAMQLHTYSLDAVVSLLLDAGVGRFYMERTEIDQFQNITLYGQRS